MPPGPSLRARESTDLKKAQVTALAFAARRLNNRSSAAIEVPLLADPGRSSQRPAIKNRFAGPVLHSVRKRS